MKRILYIIYTLQAGGIESLGMNIFRNIDREKYHFDFIVIKDKDEKQFFDDEVYELGGTIIPVGNMKAGKLRKYLSYEKGIHDVIKNGNYDVIHINSGHIHTLPELYFAYKSPTRNVIVHSHNGELVSTAKFYKLRCMIQSIYQKCAPKFATHLFTCSDLAAKWAFSEDSIKAGNVIQINNGVDPQKYKYDEKKRVEFRQSIGVKDELVVGHIGRLSKQKNHEFLIEAFQEVLRLIPDAKLLLCGTGDLEEKLKHSVDSKGISRNVIFYGVTKDVPAVLSAIDVFAFPSLFEGLPVVGIEAQASGVPIVASDTISTDVIVSPCWHTLSLNESPSTWANEIIACYRNGKRLDTEQMIQDAGFDIRKTVEMITKIYDEE